MSLEPLVYPKLDKPESLIYKYVLPFALFLPAPLFIGYILWKKERYRSGNNLYICLGVIASFLGMIALNDIKPNIIGLIPLSIGLFFLQKITMAFYEEELQKTKERELLNSEENITKRLIERFKNNQPLPLVEYSEKKNRYKKKLLKLASENETKKLKEISSIYPVDILTLIQQGHCDLIYSDYKASTLDPISFEDFLHQILSATNAKPKKYSSQKTNKSSRSEVKIIVKNKHESIKASIQKLKDSPIYSQVNDAQPFSENALKLSLNLFDMASKSSLRKSAAFRTVQTDLKNLTNRISNKILDKEVLKNLARNMKDKDLFADLQELDEFCYSDEIINFVVNEPHISSVVDDPKVFFLNLCVLNMDMFIEEKLSAIYKKNTGHDFSTKYLEAKRTIVTEFESLFKPIELQVIVDKLIKVQEENKKIDDDLDSSLATFKNVENKAKSKSKYKGPKVDTRNLTSEEQRDEYLSYQLESIRDQLDR